MLCEEVVFANGTVADLGRFICFGPAVQCNKPPTTIVLCRRGRCAPNESFLNQTGTIEDQKTTGDVEDDLTVVANCVVVVELNKKVGVVPALAI